MLCSICKVEGHNISTRPALLMAKHNVNVKRDELAQAERELATIEQQISQQTEVNSMRRAARAKKKKPGEKGESQSRGSDTETSYPVMMPASLTRRRMYLGRKLTFPAASSASDHARRFSL